MIGLIASGRLSTVYNASAASAGSTYNSGFAYDSTGKVQVDTAAVSGSIAGSGIARKPSGVVYVTTADPSDSSRAMGGLMLSATGALHVHVSDAVAGAVGGIPVTAKGAVAVSAVT